MVADAYDAVTAVPGVTSAEVILDDHFASDAINAGVAARAGFVASFDGEAADELDELRATFLRKAVLAGTDQVCRPLVSGRPHPGRPGRADPRRRPRVPRARPASGTAAPTSASPPTTPPPCSSTRHRRPHRPGRASPSTSAGPSSPGPASTPTRPSAPACSRPLPRPFVIGRTSVKAVRLHKFHSAPVIDEVPEPVITGPLDVIVKIGGAGVCRTDLHIIEGQWDAAMGTPLPYVLGHENAGWVSEVGSAVTNVAVGDTVILHPTPTCGLCHACRAGDDMHCENSSFPGLSRDGGMAEYLLTSRPRVRQARPRDPPGRRRRAGRRGDHRLPRGPQGAAAAVPRHHRGRDRRGRPGPHRRPVPGRAVGDPDHRRRPQPRRAQARRGSSAPPTPSSPTAPTSTRSRTSPAARARTWCSTSSPSRARRWTPGT